MSYFSQLLLVDIELIKATYRWTPKTTCG